MDRGRSSLLFAFDVKDLGGDARALGGAPTTAATSDVEKAGPPLGRRGQAAPGEAAPCADSFVTAAEPRRADERADEAMIVSYELLSTGERKREFSQPVLPRVGPCGLVLVNAAWFASSFNWFLLLIVLVPSQVAAIVGQERKGSAIGLVLGASTPVVLVGAPLVGLLSDRVRSSFGRRRPIMLPGAFVFAGVLLGLVSTPHSLVTYGVLYTALRAAELLISAPFNGLIADLTPPELRGLASGIMGAASNIGNFAGAAVGIQSAAARAHTRAPRVARRAPTPPRPLGPAARRRYVALGPVRTASGMGVVMVAAMAATCLAAPEASTAAQPAAHPLRLRRVLLDLASPLRDADFAWVFATRLIFQMGVYTVQEFLQFYFRDAVELPAGMGAETAVSYGMLCLMTAAMLTAAAGGALTDLLGGRRKILVYAAGALMCASCMAVVLLGRSMRVTLLLLTIFGLGYGLSLIHI